MGTGFSDKMRHKTETKGIDPTPSERILLQSKSDPQGPAMAPDG